MTYLTLLTIASNYPDNIQVLASEPTLQQGGGKTPVCAGFIYLMREGQIHRLLISTVAQFENKEMAETKLHEVCKECVRIAAEGEC